MKIYSQIPLQLRKKDKLLPNIFLLKCRFTESVAMECNWYTVASFFGMREGGRQLLTSGQYHRSTYVNYAVYVVPCDSLTTNEDYLQTDK